MREFDGSGYPPRRPDADARFADWVLGLHQLLPLAPGGTLDCSCGSPAVLCSYLRAAHDLLGHPMPWDAPYPTRPPRPDHSRRPRHPTYPRQPPYPPHPRHRHP